MRSISGGYYYKIGVIDFMTRHSVMKTMETNIKSAFYNVKRNTISAQNPTDYQERFVNFFREKLHT